MKRFIALLLAALLATMCFAGCTQEPAVPSQAPENNNANPAEQPAQDTDPGDANADNTGGADDKLTIALSNAGLTIPFFVYLEEGAKEYVTSQGYEFIASNADFDPTKQCADIEDFVIKGVDGILVVGSDQSAIDATIDDAVAAGIPCVQIDMHQQTTSPICFVGSDNFAGGKLIGEYARDYIEKNCADQEVLIGIITRVEASIQLDRVDGFKAAFEGVENVKFLDAQDAYEAEEAMNVTENLLQANPDLDFLYVTSSNAVGGAYAAVESAGNDHVKMFGFDMSVEGADGIESGTILAITEQLPDVIGSTAAEILIQNILTGEKPDAYDVLTPCMIYDQSNVSEFQAGE